MKAEWKFLELSGDYVLHFGRYQLTIWQRTRGSVYWRITCPGILDEAREIQSANPVIAQQIALALVRTHLLNLIDLLPEPTEADCTVLDAEVNQMLRAMRDHKSE